MSEDLTALVTALSALSPGQFLLLSLGLASSVLSCLPGLTRIRALGPASRLVSALVWGLSWFLFPNAVAEWDLSPDHHHIIKRSKTFLSLFIKESQPEVLPPHGIAWDNYTLLLVVFSFVFVLKEVSSVPSYYLNAPAPVALLDDRPFYSPPRGRLLPLSATGLNTLCGHIQRATLSCRLLGTQADNFSIAFNWFIAALPQNLQEWVVGYATGCSSFPNWF